MGQINTDHLFKTADGASIEADGASIVDPWLEISETVF